MTTHANALTGLSPVLLALLLLQPPAFAASDLVTELDTLLAQGRFEDAYELAREGLFEHEGNPEFDFRYGLAALESGEADEAVFAFERIAASYPDQRRIKLELARAHFLSNNLGAAENLFREVLATEPEANVKANIDAFLGAIEDRRNALRTRLDFFLTSAVGSDSNINSATELGVISTPIGDIELSPDGQSLEDDFAELGGGFTYNRPLDKNRSLSVNGRYNRHDNLQSDRFDLQTLSLEASYAVVRSNQRFTHGLRAQRVLLGDAGFQRSGSLLSTWQRNGRNGWNQLLTGAVTAIRYDNTPASPANSLRDVNQVLVSGGLGKVTGSFVHNVSLYMGDERSVRDAGRNNAQRFWGLAFSQQYHWNANHVPFVQLSVHRSDNKALDPVFNIEREDETYSASLGWLWRLNSQLDINTDVTYTDSDSNIPLYAYDRLKYQTGIRFRF